MGRSEEGGRTDEEGLLKMNSDDQAWGKTCIAGSDAGLFPPHHMQEDD